MEFSCCSERKSNNKSDVIKQKITPSGSKWLRSRNDALELIQNFNESIEIGCSYILCGKKGIRPLEKQATIRNNIYYFCSIDCWEDWLKEYDVKNYATSPSSLDSPQNIKKYYEKIDLIPTLFI